MYNKLLAMPNINWGSCHYLIIIEFCFNRYNGQLGWAASFYLVPCAASNQANWTVLGVPLTSEQLRWLNYTAVNVVPRLKIYYNNAEEALNNTAYVAWWSLKVRNNYNSFGSRFNFFAREETKALNYWTFRITRDIVEAGDYFSIIQTN